VGRNAHKQRDRQHHEQREPQQHPMRRRIAQPTPK
jgi:hypothetical protein